MSNPLLICRGVSKSYVQGSNRIDALKKVSFSVQKGEFVALKGPSGSGKSTLLNVCGMLDRPDKGECEFDGRNYSDEGERTILRRNRIGFVFQDFGLVPIMTAYENIEYPLLLGGLSPSSRREKIEWVMEAVGISDFRSHQPDKLSGGQRQRVAVARALVKRPALVVADEPTANLDTQTAESVIELMKTLSQEIGSTFLIATHDDRMSGHCDRVITLTDGVMS